ncbi:MAG: glycosyltransferase family A protein [Verrucomicrobiota bacterium]
MNSPDVSILIPCYNAARWLADSIESAAGQTVDSKEIIIVDDGSTDNSLQVARRHESNQIRVISQTNRGASAARNTALRAARGKYIQYLDSDDLLSKDKVLHQIERLKSAPKRAVATCRWDRFEKDPSSCHRREQDNFKDLSPVEFLQLNWEQDIMMHPAAWLIPRDVADRAGTWNESLTLNDDGEYFSRIALASSQLAYTPDAGTYYRSNLTSSLSGRKDAKSLLSQYHSIKLTEAHLLNFDTSDRTCHACACAHQRLAYAIFRHHPALASRSEQRARQLSDLPLPHPGGDVTRRFARWIGWRHALRLQSVYSSVLKLRTKRPIA